MNDIAPSESQTPGESNAPHATTDSPPPVARTLVAGVLMGLANLVPGISGGTMVVIMGLYDRFVSSIADVTRLTFRRGQVMFLVMLAIAAIIAIGAGAGTLRDLVTFHRMEMFSLFIGMTLGGVPLLVRMLGDQRGIAIVGGVVGLALMTLVAVNQAERPDRESIKEALAAGELVVESDYGRDVVAGVLGMSAMILPGISGAYMLLIIGRYEAILTAISTCKAFVTSGGSEGDISLAVAILAPVCFGAAGGIILLSNALKWMLREKKDLTIGLLLGILCGSVIGIWPFDADSTSGNYLLGAGLTLAGFLSTVLLGRLGR